MSMEIIAIVGLVVMGMILGSVLTRKEKDCGLHWDYDLKSAKVSELEHRVFVLEAENKRLNYIFRNWEMKKRSFEEEYFAHCRWCNKNFYSKTPETKELADLLKKGVVNIEDLAKKLDIEIK